MKAKNIYLDLSFKQVVKEYQQDTTFKIFMKNKKYLFYSIYDKPMAFSHWSSLYR
jgi:hypothetical protein